MAEVNREYVGSLDLSDLAQLCNLQGFDDLPYPFTQTGRPGLKEASADLQVFRTWVNSYAHADIWVDSRVMYRPNDIPDTRVLAFRADQLGFCASQRSDEDVIDVYQLSPYELGAAVANLMTLTGPGRHPRISIPKYMGYFRRATAALNNDDDDDYEFSVLDAVPRNTASAATNVPNAHVAAMGTVQSHCEPAHSWGVDWDKNLVAWVQVRDDGDYIYEPDFSHAMPMTEQKLVNRIDQLIAEDVAHLRSQRRNHLS